MVPSPAVSTLPTCAPPVITGAPVAGVLGGSLVVPRPPVDHSLLPSSLVARTCTAYSVPASRPEMLALWPVTFCGPFIQTPVGPCSL